MTDYVERKIASINDQEFQTLVAELCRCVDWSKDEFENKTLANLFAAIVIEDKKPNLQKILIGNVLTLKVKKLPSNSVVHAVCYELANRKGKPMDDFADKSVFMLIKQCYTAVCPPKPRPQRPTQWQRKRQFETALILQRRRNGSL